MWQQCEQLFRLGYQTDSLHFLFIRRCTAGGCSVPVLRVYVSVTVGI